MWWMSRGEPAGRSGSGVAATGDAPKLVTEARPSVQSWSPRVLICASPTWLFLFPLPTCPNFRGSRLRLFFPRREFGLEVFLPRIRRSPCERAAPRRARAQGHRGINGGDPRSGEDAVYAAKGPCERASGATVRTRGGRRMRGTETKRRGARPLAQPAVRAQRRHMSGLRQARPTSMKFRRISSRKRRPTRPKLLAWRRRPLRYSKCFRREQSASNTRPQKNIRGRFVLSGKRSNELLARAC